MLSSPPVYQINIFINRQVFVVVFSDIVGGDVKASAIEPSGISTISSED